MTEHSSSGASSQRRRLLVLVGALVAVVVLAVLAMQLLSSPAGPVAAAGTRPATSRPAPVASASPSPTPGVVAMPPAAVDPFAALYVPPVSSTTSSSSGSSSGGGGGVTTTPPVAPPPPPPPPGPAPTPKPTPKKPAGLTASLGPAGVAVYGHFTVTFSAAPKASTVNSSTVWVLDARQRTVAGRLAQHGAKVWTLTPSGLLVPGETYRLVLSGVRSDAGTVATVANGVVRAATTVDNTSPSAVETWERDKSSHASGGAYLFGSAPGEVATLRFTGTSVVLEAPKSHDGGYAQVYLDGALVTRLDFYAPATVWNIPMFSRFRLADTAHKLQIRVEGSHQAGATGTSVFVDDFVVNGHTVVQENSAEVVEGWSRTNAHGAIGGSYDSVRFLHPSFGSAPTFSTSFEGSAVSVVFCRSAYSGKAAVFIDGVQKAVVDLYQSHTSCGWSWSTATTVGPIHQVEIRPLSSLPAGSRGTWVSVDAIRIS